MPDPAATLADLEDKLRALERELVGGPPAPTAAAPPGPGPPPVSSRERERLLGRLEELDELRAHLERSTQAVLDEVRRLMGDGEPGR